MNKIQKFLNGDYYLVTVAMVGAFIGLCGLIIILNNIIGVLK